MTVRHMPYCVYLQTSFQRKVARKSPQEVPAKVFKAKTKQSSAKKAKLSSYPQQEEEEEVTAVI